MAYIGQSLTEGTRRAYTFVATSGQTTFNAVYGVGAVDVYQNGILLQPSDYNSSSGSSVVLGVGAAVNDEITIIAHNTFSVADTLTASQGGTFTGNVQFDGSFTSKGIDDNADATAVTIDSLENVMVGKTSAGIANTGSEFSSTGRAFFTYDGGGPLQLNRKTSDGDIIELHKDGTEVGSIGVSGGNNMYLSGQANNHAGVTFATQSILPTTQGAVNNNTVDIGQNGNAFKDLYLGGGLYVGGTGAANKLDDYEEGTFTPAIAGTTNTPGFWNNTGKYTKIGNMVMIQYFTQLSHSPAPTFSNNAAALVITGLPFTVVGSGYTGSQGVMNSQAFGWNGSLNTQSVSGQVSASAVDNNTQIRFQVTGNTSTRGEVTNQALVNQAAIIEVTLFYRTA